MQYGIKKESLEEVKKALERAEKEVISLHQKMQDPKFEASKHQNEIVMKKEEIALTILDQIEKALEEIDFVILSKEEYDSIFKYVMS